MSKITWDGGALLAPIPPVMVSCGSPEKPNIITVAWCGMLATQPPMTYISVRPKRFSYNLIRKSGEFVINLTTASLIKAADSCGVYTGAKVDKFSRCHLTPESCTKVACPMIAESPLSLECRVTKILPMGSHDMFIAEIVAVNLEEKLLDRNGKLRLDNADLAAFAHGEYFRLGTSLGTFGFSVKKKGRK